MSRLCEASRMKNTYGVSTDDELRALLVSRFTLDHSQTKIAKEFGVSQAAICAKCKKLGIIGRRQDLRSTETLRSMYEDDGMNMSEIATRLGVTYQAVAWHMAKGGIPQRSASDIQKKASTKRGGYEKTIFGEWHNLRSRGYLVEYDTQRFYSAAELTYGFILNADKITYRTQPELFHTDIGWFQPDFLVTGSTMVEVKSSDLNTEEMLRYALIESELGNLGYAYEIRYIHREYPTEYHRIKSLLRSRGARPGKLFHWTDSNPLSCS